jgi:hypothetical protein
LVIGTEELTPMTPSLAQTVSADAAASEIPAGGTTPRAQGSGGSDDPLDEYDQLIVGRAGDLIEELVERLFRLLLGRLPLGQ